MGGIDNEESEDPLGLLSFLVSASNTPIKSGSAPEWIRKFDIDFTELKPTPVVAAPVVSVNHATQAAVHDLVRESQNTRAAALEQIAAARAYLQAASPAPVSGSSFWSHKCDQC